MVNALISMFDVHLVEIGAGDWIVARCKETAFKAAPRAALPGHLSLRDVGQEGAAKKQQ
jgi:hypothetical protein